MRRLLKLLADAGRFVLVASVVLIVLTTPSIASEDKLESAFRRPSRDARPWVYWFWMNGNITKEGITADLEAMRRVGIGGTLIMSVSTGIPPGKVDFFSAEWRGMFVHAIREADRLGLRVIMNNDDGWTGSGGPWNRVEDSMQMLTSSQIQLKGPSTYDGVVPRPRAQKGYYRDVALFALPGPATKAGDGGRGGDLENASPTPAAKDRIVDLTSKLAADGRLTWSVPEGDWTLLRLGHTTTGAMNHPTTPLGRGLECDKLSREALDKHLAGFLDRLIDDVGPLAGKTLVGTHIDSWEIGSQNWTPRFREEFQARRGYDPTPYLAALVGRDVESREVSDRFRWDHRRTIAELIADNHFSHLRAAMKKRGMGLSVEAYGGNFNYIQCASRADIPMAEFWVNTRPHWIEESKGPASAGHVAGRKVIAAEAFTAFAPSARWQNHPYSLKAVGDMAFTKGINRLVFHRWAMQPWLDRLPGMTFGEYGTHYERTVTWFEQSRAWIDYLTRCQALLQEGRFVADLCYFTGQESPNRLPKYHELDPAPPLGYDYDGCDEETILRRMRVEDGRLVLASGMSYRLLVLPPARTMTPELLAKIKELVREGAHVVGPKPERSPSLTGYPECDRQVAELANELWGDTSMPGTRAVGRGRVYWGMPLREVLGRVGVPRDVVFNGLEKSQIPWIHRRVEGADVYFVSNQGPYPARFDATFRVGSRIPELWHPDTGAIERAGVWECTADGRTAVRFRLEPCGSVFVVFRKQALRQDSVVDVSRDGRSLTRTAPLAKITIHKALYGLPEQPEKMIDVTDKVRAVVDTPNRSIRVWTSGPGNIATNVPRSIVAEVSVNGRRMTLAAKAQQDLMLPWVDEPDRPDAEVRYVGGRRCLVASKPGNYELTMFGWGKRTLGVPDVPDDVPVEGPWEVRFPPGWGAGESITLARLLSWPEHAEEGVKYFSGTAVYHKTLEVRADQLGEGKDLYLDLGRVAVIAEVQLNGRDLGILWKPPFRVSFAEAARVGENRLEVRVTNLWPNRLIGDEQKPPYLRFDLVSQRGGNPIEWPDWVARGAAVPETGRLTFTTWHHYDKDSPLLESGLLGPVTLQSARIVPCDRVTNSSRE